MSPLRVMQLGCGRWGQRVLAAIQRNAAMHLVAVVDTDPQARARAESLAEGVLVAAAAEDVLALADAAVVVTPPSQHASNAHQLLDAGLHVLVEKPLTDSSLSAQDLVTHAARKNRIAAVGNLLRFHPAVRDVVAAAKGQGPFEIKMRRFSQSQRTNPLWALGPHDVDTLLALDSSGIEDIEVRQHDWLEVQLRLRSGTRAIMQFSTRMPPARTLTVQNHTSKYEADELSISADPLDLQLTHFAECIRSGQQPTNDFASGARVVQLLEQIDAVIKSSEATKQWAP